MSSPPAVQKRAQLAAYLRSMFTANMLLKAMSLVFAVVLWFIVMTQSNPLRSRTIYDVPVEITGMSAMSEKNLAVTQEALKAIAKAAVDIEMPQSDLRLASNQTVKARIDLSTVSETGAKRIQLSASVPSSGRVLKITPSYVELTVEPMMRSTVPVQKELTDTLPEGYRIDKVEVQPSRVRLSGPESVVSRVAGAKVSLSLSGVTGNINKSVGYVLVDEAGQPVPTDSITLLDDATAILSARVEPMQARPISYEQSVVGTVAEGYRIASIDIQPREVQISAAQEVLESIESMALSAIDVQGKSESFTQMVAINKPNDVNWMSVDHASVVVSITEQSARKTFTDVEVKVINQPGGTDVQYGTLRVKLEIEAARSVIRELTREDVEAYVDLAAASVGAHDLPIEVRIEGNPAFTFAASPMTMPVSVSSLPTN